MCGGKVPIESTKFLVTVKLSRMQEFFIHSALNNHVVNGLPITARRYNLVSVTRRSIRAESWYFSHKVVPVQGEYGAVFAIRVQNFMSITRVAVQV